MKKRMISIGEILISLGLIPLWFVKFFHGVGHLPSQSDPNTIVQVDFYHSMYENYTDSQRRCSYETNIIDGTYDNIVLNHLFGVQSKATRISQ